MKNQSSTESAEATLVEMSAERSARTRIFPYIAAALLCCCVSLALLIGNIGFQGDDWWQFAFPYWNSFPCSVWEYAIASRRPVEGLYTVIAFELFGLNRILYTLSALFLLAGACLLMGKCLHNAFPGRNAFVVLSTFFAFLLPSVSNLIYMFHTDNSRISSLFFWTSALAFQKWATGKKTWIGLIVPLLLYFVAAFTYENTTFLIFAIPLLVWPVYLLNQGDLSTRTFLVRIGSVVFGGFLFFVIIRFAVLSGGAVGHRSLLPSLDLIWSYAANLVRYSAAPLQFPPGDPLSWAWGIMVAIIAGLLLIYADRAVPTSKEEPGNCAYIALVGTSVLILGILPYALAGYRSEVDFTSQSRIYSSASFGLAVLGGLFFSVSANHRIKLAKKAAAIVLIAVMAAFLAGLRVNWQSAEEKRSAIYSSLRRAVPDVTPGTTFLFLDLQSYISESKAGSAVVFQGVDGLDEFIKMFYNDRDVYAYFLYSPKSAENNEENRALIASADGVVARGSALRPPIPLDSLLILKRDNGKMILLDSVDSTQDVAIVWQGISEIRSNKDRILQNPKDGIIPQFDVRETTK
ncbi:hypothetical protein [Desulfomonile tiedjei]|uniref:Glycosyltransferase RgtA/B/C/D-like domain-containing protein n=1 Tax=Desulfomonile tiedjei (strain ATCC 49306 / DSM 6799 / DCB-1) TaxID=706587 RepID=I4C2U0_DESTA|nr:hypothetical protein [Desulfomonile tiedjei]AFM23881.1 hypothetical protein Desti_1168 [Desulfomonile tiedjei DSM 6799]